MTTILRQRMTPQRLSSFETQKLESQQSYNHHHTSSPQYEMDSSSQSQPQASPLAYSPPTKSLYPYRVNNTMKYPNVSYESPSVMQANNSVTSEIHTDRNEEYNWRQRVLLLIGLICLFTPWIRHAQLQRNVQKLKDELNELHNDQQRLQNRLKTQNDAHSKITSDIKKYQSKNYELFQELRDHGDQYNDFDAAHYTEQSEKEDLYIQRIEQLELEIQRTADRQLVSRGYGVAFRRNDAIRVEIILKQNVSTYGNKLVMELGPISFLSHAISLFLMLVEHKHYYDNLILMHRSAGSSTISTVPMDSDTLQIVSSNIVQNAHTVIGSNQDKNTPIVPDRENIFMMDQLAMLEHTEDYPIQKYSVLFVDKGPHFYIKMDDKISTFTNNKSKKDKKEQQQPQETCFGRIVEGQSILDYMTSHHDSNFRGLSMVGIETLNVVVTTPVSE